MSYPGIAYSGFKLGIDLVKKIKRGDYSKHPSYVERDSDQIGYKKPQASTGPARRKFGPMPTKRAKPRRSVVKSRPAYKKRKSYAAKTKPYKKRKTVSYTKTSIKKPFKKVAISYGTSRQRVVTHKQQIGSDCAWFGTSSVGRPDDMCRSLAESLMLFYMSKVGDHRRRHFGGNTQDDNVAPFIGSNNSPTWAKILFRFAKINHASSPTGSSDVEIKSRNDLSSPTSASNPNYTLDELVTTLSGGMKIEIDRGYSLAYVSIFRDNDGNNVDSHVDEQVVYADVNAGRHKFDFSVTGYLKYQNVTPADGSGDIHDSDNINANPVDGFIYKFKNRVPKFHSSFIIGHQSQGSMDDLQYLNATSPGGLVVPALSTLDANFKVPIPSPSTVWSNTAGKVHTSIRPGKHAQFKFTEKFVGTFERFVDRYFNTGATDATLKIPPGGDSYLVALKPTYRSATGEDVVMQCEWTHTYHGKIVQCKATPLILKTTIRNA